VWSLLFGASAIVQRELKGEKKAQNGISTKHASEILLVNTNKEG